ncbi:MAG: ABC transporter permease [Candidatus Sericytochromatia bacterium]|nr:ABC transporter permease [Candidatus Sericytochromatia bacterium]
MALDASQMTRQWLFSLQQGLQNMVRSPFMSLVVVSTMTVALGVLGFLMLTLSDLTYISQQMSTQLKIVVFLQDQQTPESAAALIEGIKGVKAPVVQISKEEALKSMTEELPDLKKLLEDPHTHEVHNPFPATLEVSLYAVEKMAEIEAEIKKNVPGVEGTEANQDLAEQLNQIQSAVQLVGFGIAAILFLGTLAIVINTIQLAVHHRQREIEIMHLVGAPDWFIRLPFLLEGLIFGMASGLVANILLFFWRVVPLEQLKRMFTFIQLQPGLGPLYPISALVLLVGLLMGVLGSSLSVHRYIRFEKSAEKGKIPV